ncbi:hypothetical protein [Hyperthermus butylicus]|uniref:Uncharacterized protein n=1 Tax=Hyperthermus butylicus (strain DSM 5456 / JCM 9403 / PLM1-5) TaxID=415426 RepID=A2BJX2_HYPBU|nr:hypothetical protein [Hyperthermus butylicus]ABM80283.1 hypothetical protein Hbut_0417 [Hyperthermus butylicus DSM 5456]
MASDVVVKRSLVLGASRLGVAAGGIVSGLVTLIPVLFLNIGIPVEYVEKIFLALYVAALPVLLASMHTLYQIARGLAGSCGLGRIDPISFIAALLPLGYPIALYMVLSLASHCGSLRGKLSPTLIDVFLNLITFGLHSIVYSIAFNRILDIVISELGEPY